jgi:hypothetical protein
VGVPTGGSAGQVLAKIDATDYNTAWVTPSVGGGGGNHLTTVVVTVPSPCWEYQGVVTVSGATASKKVQATLAQGLDEENDYSTVVDDSIVLTAIAEEGAIRFILSAKSRITGPFTIHYHMSS